MSTFWIWYLGDSRASALKGNAGLSEADYERERRRLQTMRRQRTEAAEQWAAASEKAYTEIGHVLVCNSCRQSTSKYRDGRIPAECPACGQRFQARRDRDSGERRPVRTARLAADDVVELRVADDPVRR